MNAAQPDFYDTHAHLGFPDFAGDLAETVALMKRYQDLKTDQPASGFWTDELLPK